MSQHHSTTHLSPTAIRIRKRKKSYLDGKTCADCGSIADLEFHHIDPSTKVNNIGRMWTRRREVLEAEIAKCEVICHLCHLKRHGKDLPQHGTTHMYEAGKCRCDECREAKRVAIAKRRASLTPDSATHGTTNGYYNYGCRCDRCREAVRIERQQQRAAKKAAQ